MRDLLSEDTISVPLETELRTKGLSTGLAENMEFQNTCQIRSFPVGTLYTKPRLNRANIVNTDTGLLCGMESESPDHLLLSCNYARNNWRGSALVSTTKATFFIIREGS